MPLAAALLLGCAATMLPRLSSQLGKLLYRRLRQGQQQRRDGRDRELPYQETVGRKTLCFQNDPALTEQQGGH